MVERPFFPIRRNLLCLRVFLTYDVSIPFHYYMDTNIYICMYIFDMIYTYIYLCVYIYTYIYIFYTLHIHVCTYILHIQTYVYMYIIPVIPNMSASGSHEVSNSGPAKPKTAWLAILY